MVILLILATSLSIIITDIITKFSEPFEKRKAPG